MNRRRLLSAIAVAVLAVVTACGDDDDGSAPTSPPPASGTAVPTTAEATTSAPPPSVAPTTAATPPPTTAAPTTAPSEPPPSTAATTEAPAATEPLGDPEVTLTEVVDLDGPVDLAWREGDAGLYVVEKVGQIVRIGDGDPTTVLDVSDLTSEGSEQGLLGLAFAPGGDVAYINYTDNNGDTVISEHPVAADGTFGTGDSARIVLEIDQPYANHNGGHLAFGPDGYLYVGMGDGGAGGDPKRRATDLSTPLGKLLRIDPAIAKKQPYTVPRDNPFVGTEGAAPEIWASGLRNPWRFSFDRDTGDLWIADVGQSAWEEIDVAPATDGLDAGKGLSFGWSAFEGDARYNEDVSPDGHTPPIATYGHDVGCSISGGVRVRGGPVPALEGWYVYGDYCSGLMWALEVTGKGAHLAAGRTVELPSVESPTSVVAGPSGEVYVLSQAGPVYRLDPA
jgi:glucose/arabinose dehydrogenase